MTFFDKQNKIRPKNLLSLQDSNDFDQLKYSKQINKTNLENERELQKKYIHTPINNKNYNKMTSSFEFRIKSNSPMRNNKNSMRFSNDNSDFKSNFSLPTIDLNNNEFKEFKFDIITSTPKINYENKINFSGLNRQSNNHLSPDMELNEDENSPIKLRKSTVSRKNDRNSEKINKAQKRKNLEFEISRRKPSVLRKMHTFNKTRNQEQKENIVESLDPILNRHLNEYIKEINTEQQTSEMYMDTKNSLPNLNYVIEDNLYDLMQTCIQLQQVDQNEIKKIAAKQLIRNWHLDFFKFQKKNYKKPEIFFYEANIIAKELNKLEPEFRNAIKEMLKVIPIQKSLQIEKISSLQFNKDLVNSVADCLFGEKLTQDWNEFQAFLLKYFFQVNKLRSYFLSQKFIDDDNNFYINHKDLWNMLQNSYAQPFKRDVANLSQFICGLEDNDTNQYISLHMARNKQMVSSINNSKFLNKNILGILVNKHSKDIQSKDKLILFKDFLKIKFANDVPDTYSVVIFLIVGFWNLRQNYIHLGLEPFNLQVQIYHKDLNIIQNRKEFLSLQEEINDLKENIYKLSKEEYINIIYDNKINKYIDIGRKGNEMNINFKFSKDMFENRIVTEFLPILTFDHLKSIKERKIKLFDAEFKSQLRTLAVEFLEHKNFLRNRIPDSQQAHFRTILNTYFNLADFRVDFEYISDQSIRSQSKQLFGVHSPYLAKSLMRNLNLDGDGKIDYMEFCQFMEMVLDEHAFWKEGNRQKWGQYLFKMFDKDENGIVTWKDLSELSVSREQNIDKRFRDLQMWISNELNKNQRNHMLNESSQVTVVNFERFEDQLEEHQIQDVLIDVIRKSIKGWLSQRVNLIKNHHNCHTELLEKYESNNQPLTLDILVYMLQDENQCMNMNDLIDQKDDHIVEL